MSEAKADPPGMGGGAVVAAGTAFVGHEGNSIAIKLIRASPALLAHVFKTLRRRADEMQKVAGDAKHSAASTAAAEGAAVALAADLPFGSVVIAATCAASKAVAYACGQVPAGMSGILGLLSSTGTGTVLAGAHGVATAAMKAAEIAVGAAADALMLVNKLEHDTAALSAADLDAVAHAVGEHLTGVPKNHVTFSALLDTVRCPDPRANTTGINSTGLSLKDASRHPIYVDPDSIVWGKYAVDVAAQGDFVKELFGAMNFWNEVCQYHLFFVPASYAVVTTEMSRWGGKPEKSPHSLQLDVGFWDKATHSVPGGHNKWGCASFDLRGGVVGHAQASRFPDHLNICFDSAEVWKHKTEECTSLPLPTNEDFSDKVVETNTTTFAVHFKTVAIHELGHIIGLQHTDTRQDAWLDTIMRFCYLGPFIPDLAAVQRTERDSARLCIGLH